MKIKCAHTELVDVDKLILLQNPKNNNRHSPEQINRLAKIIDFAGQRKSIVISKRSGFINTGHGTLLAIAKLGWKQAAVDYQDFDTEAAEYQNMTADNEIARWAFLDVDKLLTDAKDLDLGDLDLLGLENESDVMKKLLGSDLNLDDELAKNNVSVENLDQGVKRAILIEFELPDFEKATDLIKSLRNDDVYVGGLILELLDKYLAERSELD